MKNIKTVIRVLSVSAFAAAVLMLSGCSSAENQANVAVIALNGKNSAVAAEAALEDAVAKVAYGGTISLVQADVDPAVKTYTYDAIKASNKSMFQNNINSIQAHFKELNADDPETDLVLSFQKAGRALNAAGNAKKELVVAHSGLSTTGALPFQNLADLEDQAQIPTVISALQNAGELADLSSVSVRWFYAGDTMGEQPKLSNNQVEFIKALWEAYINACGGTVVFEDDLPGDYPTPEDAPDVTVVETGIKFTLPQPVALDEASGLGFKPDTTDFIDDEVATKQLTQLAAQLQEDCAEYLLAGSTADTDCSLAESQSFGLQRAQKVKAVLLAEAPELEGRLKAVGLGTAETSLRSAEDDQSNRVVWLVRADSDIGKELTAVAVSE